MELYSASKSGRLDDVKRLLEEKVSADVDVETPEWTPLMIACYNRHTAIVSLLLENGAEVNRQNAMGWTAVMTCAIRKSDECLELILEKTPDLSLRDNMGRTVLILAQEFGNVSSAKMIEEYSSLGDELGPKAAFMGVD